MDDDIFDIIDDDNNNNRGGEINWSSFRSLSDFDMPSDIFSLIGDFSLLSDDYSNCSSSSSNSDPGVTAGASFIELPEYMLSTETLEEEDEKVDSKTMTKKGKKKTWRLSRTIRGKWTIKKINKT